MLRRILTALILLLALSANCAVGPPNVTMRDIFPFWIDSGPVLYWNTEQTATCPAGTTGQPSVVPANTVSSLVSVVDANSAAYAMAVNSLVCTQIVVTYWNEEQTATCPGGSVGGPSVTPSNTVSSTISLEAANNLAYSMALSNLFCTNIFWNTEQTATCPAGSTGSPSTIAADTVQSFISVSNANEIAYSMAVSNLVCVPDAPSTYWNEEQTAVCPPNSVGGPSVIAANTVSSQISVADANAIAYAQAMAALHCTPIYWNTEQTATCPLGTIGSPVTIPANTYSSTISQAHANSIALAAANAALVCTPIYWNVEQTATCPAGYHGTPVVCPAYTFFSEISQADADLKAYTWALSQLSCIPDVIYWNAQQTANCPAWMFGPAVTVFSHTYSSTTSQADADAQAYAAAYAQLQCSSLDPSIGACTVAVDPPLANNIGTIYPVYNFAPLQRETALGTTKRFARSFKASRDYGLCRVAIEVSRSGGSGVGQTKISIHSDAVTGSLHHPGSTILAESLQVSPSQWATYPAWGWAVYDVTYNYLHEGITYWIVVSITQDQTDTYFYLAGRPIGAVGPDMFPYANVWSVDGSSWTSMVIGGQPRYDLVESIFITFTTGPIGPPFPQDHQPPPES